MATNSLTLEEHCGFLTDERKLALYSNIIARSVGTDTLVADLGCGSGVLGLLCLKAGAARVWGVDQTDAIEIARETMRRAGFAERYVCIGNSTFRATLPEPVDLIVCDHVGYFGIDYGIIALLRDARRRFLKPGGRIVPERIDLILAPAASPDLRAKADAWAAPNIPAEYHWLREYGINTKHGHDFAAGDLAGPPTGIGSIDLAEDNPDYLRFSAELTVTADGALDGLAGWFDCELGLGVRMTNSPLAADRIARSQIFLPFGEAIEAAAGDVLTVELGIRHDEGLIAWTVHHPRSGRRLRQSTWQARLLSQADLHRDSGRSLALSELAKARQIVWSYIDGTRTISEIEQAVLRDHPRLCPSTDAIARFVRHEVSRSIAE